MKFSQLFSFATFASFLFLVSGLVSETTENSIRALLERDLASTILGDIENAASCSACSVIDVEHCLYPHVYAHEWKGTSSRPQSSSSNGK